VTRIYIAGLTLDYCVRWSSLDARRLLPEAQIFVIVDATRPVDSKTGEEALRELAQARVHLVQSSEVRAGIERASAV
jgi:nicotinamidase/pyrazinamidase